MPVEDDGTYCLQMNGLVYLKAGKRNSPFASIAQPDTQILNQRDQHLSGSVQLPMIVAYDSLDSIERARHGSGVELRFDLRGLLLGPPGHRWTIRGQVKHREEASQWDNLLEQAKFHERVRLVVPTLARGTEDEDWSNALRRLRRAQKALQRGDSRGAIRDVRHIIELLWPEVPPTAGDHDERTNRTLEERFRHVIGAVKEVSHPSHHEDEITKKMQWTRSDAIAALATIAAMMQRQAGRP